MQYLFALAVVEACRSECVLGSEAGSRVRIKWPNDLYAVTLDGEKKKIGGILVNTSFSAGRVELVVGQSPTELAFAHNCDMLTVMSHGNRMRPERAQPAADHLTVPAATRRVRRPAAPDDGAHPSGDHGPL